MRIALLGDVALFRAYSLNNNRCLREKLSKIGQYLSDFDLVVCNLESPFSIEKKTYGAKSAYICSDIENAEILKLLHVDGVTLANNHIYDFGEEGYQTTIQELNRIGIHYFGYDSLTWDVEKNGNKIRFYGYCCYSTNPLNLSKKQNGKGINTYNIGYVANAISTAHLNGYLPIVAVHAGTEHVNYPSLEHIRASRQLAGHGPYIYYGHHPHVVQGVEEYKGSLIAHSLGNFCFDDVYTSVSGKKPLVELTEQNRTGMVLELTIEQNKLISWKEQAIFIGKDGHISIVNHDEAFLKYNKVLAKCEENPEKYINNRNGIIESRLAERKAKRNLMWVLKRLKPRYVRILLNAKRNASAYRKNVISNLTNL